MRIRLVIGAVVAAMLLGVGVLVGSVMGALSASAQAPTQVPTAAPTTPSTGTTTAPQNKPGQSVPGGPRGARGFGGPGGFGPVGGKPGLSQGFDPGGFGPNGQATANGATKTISSTTSEIALVKSDLAYANGKMDTTDVQRWVNGGRFAPRDRAKCQRQLPVWAGYGLRTSGQPACRGCRAADGR